MVDITTSSGTDRKGVKGQAFFFFFFLDGLGRDPGSQWTEVMTPERTCDRTGKGGEEGYRSNDSEDSEGRFEVCIGSRGIDE